MVNSDSPYADAYEASKFSLPEYDGLETDFRVLEALEALTGDDVMGSDGAAQAAWLTSDLDAAVVGYVLDKYPDSRGEMLRWGQVLLRMPK